MIYLATKHPYPLRLPYFRAPSPSAGFPSPAADFVEGQLDLNLHLVRRPEATFFVRIAGCSLERAGIHDGDLAIVDRSLTPRTGQSRRWAREYDRHGRRASISGRQTI